MYLKSIEVQGFKSFANKIVFQFHNGITAIVGPNGSGKSNVGDAVRWVLGEQRAKQLRGASMQDVIFSGTENRKPLGFAYVAITLDNSDHQLPIDFKEVTVARRVYRSGESEYLINGSACRLKDVNELFYDTGIGKEGYSIIGQGQIDKILSGKPEERRELFDEAAGIVKYKKRKITAQKKLEDERQNLVRVNDILSELTKQLGPLERQSEVAKTYLKKREALKTYDVNLFLMEMERIRLQSGQLEEKTHIANQDLEQARQDYEQAKIQYEQVERQIGDLEHQIEEKKNQANDSALQRQQLEGQINVLKEQINTAKTTRGHLEARVEAIQRELKEKGSQQEEERRNLRALKEKLESAQEAQEDSKAEADAIAASLSHMAQEIEKGKNEIITLLNQRASTKARMQRYDTMLEQIEIRKAQLSQRILRLKSEETEQEENLTEIRQKYEEVTERIQVMNQESQSCEDKVTAIQRELSEQNRKLEIGQVAYHREASRRESLKNITERYDGYGNSIRRVMEQKKREAGILGVVADLIQVEKAYEIAIETALGGSIQNIVTEDEQTAKRMIEFLKKNKFGRATFLPLTAINSKNAFRNEEALKEEGVIGLASSLVKTQEKYEGLASYLLGRTVVVDHIDHAIGLARKYRYTLRIVTLEGESLSPGGSMTGGAFKNTSNLLGRRREMEELSQNVAFLKRELDEMQEAVDKNRRERNVFRQKIVELNEKLKKEYIVQNTAKLELEQLESKQQETKSGYASMKQESSEIESQVAQIRKEQDKIQEELSQSSNREKELEDAIALLRESQEKEQLEQSAQAKQAEKIHLELAAARQKEEFANQNLSRIAGEIRQLEQEKESVQERMETGEQEATQKETEIRGLQDAAAEAQKACQAAREGGEDLMKAKEKLNQSQKSFFQKREELSERMSSLDKECFRLNAQREKLEEAKDAQINYMWEEYELTYSTAQPLQSEECDSLPQLKKNIASLKNEIKALGNVNVNAIEDFKELSQRHDFLKTQHDDLIEAEKALLEVIDELDTGMKAQFKEKFAQIQKEFDKAFKELFGGGKGSLELVEEEDILEAGIRIVSQPPGKKLQNMMQLSGGEKALTAIALLFAIQNLKPSPFCLLDEIEAALDESNVTRYAGYLHKLTKNTQFIIITHRRGTMAVADRLYGITMQEKGVSALVSVNLLENELEE